MNAWKPILAALVIFAAGVVTGGLTLRLAAPRPPSRLPPLPGEATFGRSNTELLNRMERELVLVADQRQRVGEVLRESQEKTRQLWDSISPQVQAERKRMQERIRGMLTEEQRRKYDDSFKMRGSGRGEFRGRGDDWRQEDRRGQRTNRSLGPEKMGGAREPQP